MQEEFVVFKSFNSIEEAREIVELLKEAAISFKIEDTSSPMDPVIVGSTSDPDLRVKLKQQDFSRAQDIIDTHYGDQLTTIDSTYYLFDFTDQELIEIIEKPDEWGSVDYLLAQKILNERGIPVQPEQVQQLKSERIKQIARPEPLETSWIIVGYLFAIGFGPIGIFYGLTLAGSKKTLPNGQRIYSYTPSVRNHGKNILIISILLTVCWILYRVFSVKT